MSRIVIRLFLPLLAIMLLTLAGCGWSGIDDAVGGHTKTETTTPAANVVGGKVLHSYPGASMTALFVCGTAASSDDIGTDGSFAVRNILVPCGDPTIGATLSNGVQLYSFWLGAPILPSASVTVTTEDKWSGNSGVTVTVPGSNNTFVLVDQLAHINFSLFPPDATLSSVMVNAFLNRYYATQGKDYVGTLPPTIATLTNIIASLPPVAVSPEQLVIGAGRTYTFSSLIAGTTDQRATWSVDEPGGGTITATGIYTAPFTAGTFHVRATSVAEPGKSGAATVSVPPVMVTPEQLAIGAGKTYPFSVAVASSDQRVTWSVDEPGGGTIDPSGIYTAPLTAGTYHVRATSVADPSKSDIATVTVSTGPI